MMAKLILSEPRPVTKHKFRTAPCIYVYTRIPLALFHQLWYNVRSHKTRRLFMKQFAAQFYFGYYYFFKEKK